MKSEEIQELKTALPEGTRVKLLHMEDPNPVPDGTTGTVRDVDDRGQIHVVWDNGRTLAIIPETDSYIVMK